MTEATCKPRRRWFRFSLRALLVLVAAIAVPLGWKMNELHQQQVSVAALRQAGCQIYFDNHGDNCGFPHVTRVERCMQFLGQPEPWNVYSVSGPLSDDCLTHLHGLRHLCFLDCSGTSVTDAGLANLKDQADIETLLLSKTSVTDAGLANLRGLSRLEHLDLGETAVADAGLRNLQGLTRLKTLLLEKTLVTDGGLANLQGLPRLERLDLGETTVTNAGMIHLEGLTQLKHLNLLGTGVTITRAFELMKTLPGCDAVR